MTCSQTRSNLPFYSHVESSRVSRCISVPLLDFSSTGLVCHHQARESCTDGNDSHLTWSVERLFHHGNPVRWFGKSTSSLAMLIAHSFQWSRSVAVKGCPILMHFRGCDFSYPGRLWSSVMHDTVIDLGCSAHYTVPHDSIHIDSCIDLRVSFSATGTYSEVSIRMK